MPAQLLEYQGRTIRIRSFLEVEKGSDVLLKLRHAGEKPSLPLFRVMHCTRAGSSFELQSKLLGVAGDPEADIEQLDSRIRRFAA